MDQRVWLATLGAPSVVQPGINKEETEEDQGEYAGVRRAPKREEHTYDHSAKNEGAEGDKFPLLLCDGMLLSVCVGY
jgi:hypothetical protein